MRAKGSTHNEFLLYLGVKFSVSKSTSTRDTLLFCMTFLSSTN